MSDADHITEWTQANQAFLTHEFVQLKCLLGEATPAVDDGPTAPPSLHPPAAIEQASQIFGLSSFERAILLLCAGIEMDSGLARLCRPDAGAGSRAAVTFGLALATLPDPHWSALTPAAPLRGFHLVEVDARLGLTTAPVRIDERVLHFLAGIDGLDARLVPLLRTVANPLAMTDLHLQRTDLAVQRLAAAGGEIPVVHLCGDDTLGQEDVAAAAVSALHGRLLAVASEDLPAPGADLDQVVRLWNREARLSGQALLIQCGTGGFTAAARHLAERAVGPLFLAGREPLRLVRPFIRIDVDKPSAPEQRSLWQRALGAKFVQLNGTLDHISEQFRLSAQTILATGGQAAEAGDLVAAELWNTCRSLSRPRLEDLAQRIVPAAGWDDLVLPDAPKATLRHIAAQVRHRLKVHETWGFSRGGSRGLGISVLFAGESGTGKTMAAEVLAGDLALDLYRIDLSSVVSKYIGETEKNLKRVFDAAEEGGVLLLFDEADALFGKRSDVKDSHDRYANIEVSYLLQRIESYRGLAILTTNLKSALDRAFQRRIRFSVNFPFPDAAQRELIWSRAFPAQTPTRGLDHRRLAQLNVAGGNIRSIALNAAFIAAEDGEGASVRMEHLVRAARMESEKIERPLSGAELKGWS